MRTWFLILAILLVPAAADAAVGDHLWSQGWGTEGRASADGTSHVAVAGTFFSALDLGGGSFNPVNFLGGDVFLGRFDSNGDHVWSKQITPGGFGFILQAMCTSPDGSIFVAGAVLNGDIDFGGGAIAANNEVVVAGFEPNGTHRFSFLLGDGTVKDMDASNARLALTGYTPGTMDFGGGPLVSAGANDVVLGILETDGTHLFSTIFGDTGDQGGMTVALDNGDGVVLGGNTLSDIDFGGGSLGVTTSALFAAGFNAAGAHQWSWVREGDFNPGGGIQADMDVDVSSTGDIALAGQFLGGVNLGGSGLSSVGQTDMFLARYTSAGAHLASTSYGGANSDTPQGLRFDSDDNLAVAGVFLSPSLSVGGAAPLTHSGGFGSDAFVAIFDDASAHLFDESFFGNGQYRMTPDFLGNGDLLLSGSGGGNTDFGGGAVAQTGLFLADFEGPGSGGPVSSPALARAMHLSQNSPNPFNPTTTIHFRVEEDTPVVLEVFDVAGRRVRTLRDGIAGAGEHEVVFDGRDSNGRRLASGIYRYHLRSGGQSIVKSMVLVK